MLPVSGLFVLHELAQNKFKIELLSTGDEPITLFENRSDPIFFQFWLPADPIRSPKSDHHSDPIFNPIQSFSRSDHHADLIFNPIQSFSRFDHQNLPFLTEFGPLR